MGACWIWHQFRFCVRGARDCRRLGVQYDSPVDYFSDTRSIIYVIPQAERSKSTDFRIIMETYFLKDDINVLCVSAKSFPEGISDAFDELYEIVGTTHGR